MEAIPLVLDGLPPAVRNLVELLERAGHAAFLVGGCVRDLLRGQAVGDFDIATSAAPEQVLELFPRAVPIGIRHGTVMVPTQAAPVDVTRFRGGTELVDDLGHRDFTINAMAYHPGRAELIDPFDGRTDLAKAELRAVGSARERLEEDPLRALRGARLMATLGLEVDPEVERAMREVRRALAGVARERVRRELCLILLAPGVADALALLRRTGIEAQLASGTSPDAGRVVSRLPADLELRLAGWLRGAKVGRALRGLRFSRRVTGHVEQLLRLHPLEAAAEPQRPVSVRRLLRRAGEKDVRALVALREAELACSPDSATAAADRARLQALLESLAAVLREENLALQRSDLALDGREVMEQLDCRPGPQVGRALRYLTDRALEDPACNTPARLRALLEEWWRREAKP